MKAKTQDNSMGNNLRSASIPNNNTGGNNPGVKIMAPPNQGNRTLQSSGGIPLAQTKQQPISSMMMRSSHSIPNEGKIKRNWNLNSSKLFWFWRFQMYPTWNQKCPLVMVRKTHKRTFENWIMFQMFPKKKRQIVFFMQFRKSIFPIFFIPASVIAKQSQQQQLHQLQELQEQKHLDHDDQFHDSSQEQEQYQMDPDQDHFPKLQDLDPKKTKAWRIQSRWWPLPSSSWIHAFNEDEHRWFLICFFTFTSWSHSKKPHKKKQRFNLKSTWLLQSESFIFVSDDPSSTRSYRQQGFHLCFCTLRYFLVTFLPSDWFFASGTNAR